ncbi:RidA family protein [Niallia sp. FSL R7-0648]|uniref:RidA family protein n=1 Tax=Niallia sp. FSL R7-0648 TaxID=2954521 RepID=UPI0030F91466
MSIEAKLLELGYSLPSNSTPKAMYVPVKQVGNLLFVSGQGPFLSENDFYSGKVEIDKSLEEAQKAAEICALNILAVLKEFTGNLDAITNFIKLTSFVNCSENFDKHHIVTNGASNLLYNVFGDLGRHARTAVGVSQLPFNITVEIEAIVEIDPASLANRE